MQTNNELRTDKQSDMQIQKICLPEVNSTNTWLLEALASSQPLPEGALVYTLRQMAGRGQVGNKWESEPDRNISFSLLLRPVFVPVQQQFVISEMCSVGILQGLMSLGLRNVSVKWPNDIYVGDEKVCGILIENRLMGGVLSESVLGVGINVGQTVWKSDAPNPTSLALHGIDASPEEVLDVVLHHIASLYELLHEPSGASVIHRLFCEHLYRGKGVYPYVDAQTGEAFDAEVAGVDPQGPLLLRLADGQERRYWFKEVRFALPCGVVKE